MPDPTMFYYVFSTTAQTYGAILGIVGLLVVYRLENQSKLRAAIRDRLIDEPRRFLPRLLGHKTYGWSPDEIVYNFENPDKEDKAKLTMFKSQQNEDYLYLLNELKRLNNSIAVGKRIRMGFAVFLGYHLPFVIIPSILAIFFAKDLSVYSSTVFWVLVLALFISCVITGIMSIFLLKTLKTNAPLKEAA